MSAKMKKYSAWILAITLALSIMPINICFAKDNSNLVVHYDMTHADGKLTDVTGNGYDAEMVNVKDSDFTHGSEGTALNFDATAKYVKIPKGIIQGETFTIESTFKTTTSENHWLWTLGTTVASWPNVKNYLFVNPLSAQGGYVGKVLAGIKDANSELRSDPLTPNTNELNTVVAVFDKGDLTIYLNGTATNVIKSGYSIQSILTANSAADCIGYIGRSLYSPDPYYKGSLYDFKIYNAALSESEIQNNYEANQLNYLNLAKENLTVDNIDDVCGNLTLPATGQYNTQITWTSSNPEVITNAGVVTKPSVDIAVTLTATLVLGSHSVQKAFTANVKSKNATLNLAKESLTVNDINDVRGNLTLPATGEYDTKITWKSSNTSIITDEAVGDMPAGVVTRQNSDTEVTLTATLTLGSDSVQKEFIAKVKAKTEKVTTSNYLFAYFIGEAAANQEQIYFASSKDGLNWNELNNSKPVLTSSLGEKGVRDPFIIRSPEGDKFYLIATDLSIYYNGNWSRAQTSGSQYIMVWESTDLVNWSNQRMVKIAPSDAGCTWAPEAYYDESTGEYIVFWASKVGSDNYAKQRIYYCKTRDFYTFTEPKVWLEEDYSVIDCTVIKDETTGYYYRFTKNESKTYIYLERSKSLMGTFEKVSGWSNISGAEGPTCYKLNGTDDWILLVDYFGSSGYYPYKITDLNSGSYSKLEDGTYSLPSKPRHGTVMPITEEEYKNVMAAYGSLQVDYSHIPSVVMQGDDSSKFPTTIDLSIGGIEGSKKTYSVDWNITKGTFANVGLVTVTGTLKSEQNQTITKDVLVVRKNTKYFVDSAVDLTNGGKSDYYNSLASQATLLNSKPDQEYDGTWGHTSYQWYMTGTNLAINNSGFYGANDGTVNPTYKVKLNSGTYNLDSMQYEWWTGPRTTEVHVLYKDSNGVDKDVTLGNSTVSSSSRIGMVSGQFTIDKDNTEVTITFKRTAGDAAVVSYFAIADANSSNNSPNKVEITKNDDTITAKLLSEDGKDFTTDAAVKYEWYRDDKLVEEENSAKYKLSDNDKGKRINVKVPEYNLTSDYVYIEEESGIITNKNVPDGAYDFSKEVKKGLESINAANDVKADVVLDAVKTCVKATTDSAVNVSMEDYKVEEATYEESGNITGKIKIECNNYTSKYGFNLNIAMLKKSDSDQADDFTDEVKKGLDLITASNGTKADDVIDIVKPYVQATTDSAVKLSIEDYEVTAATYEESGNITGTIIITCNDHKSKYEFNLKIAMLKKADSYEDKVDKSKLKELYNSSKNVTQGRYTDNSWSAFLSALSNAEVELNKENASQEEITNSWNALKSAIDGLTAYSSSSSESHKSKSIYSSSSNDTQSTSSQTTSSGVSEKSIKPEWNLINGKWYMLDKASGTTTTGWFNDKGSWYYFGVDGSMATGWIMDKDGTWYYLNESGAMQIGWFNDRDGSWYYLKQDGSMAHDEYIDGYYVGSNGVWIELMQG
jgi:glucan-binding YG repeat protein